MRPLRLLPAAATLLAMALLLCGCPVDPPASAPPPTGIERVRADLDAAIRTGAVGAIATLADGDRSVTLTAGRADITTGAPIPADIPQYVRVGSITKTFTAALVLHLVDEGGIELDAPIDTYLPGLLTGAGVDGHAITVRQILQHRSGLPEFADDPRMDEYEAALSRRTVTPAAEIADALLRPAQFAPGGRYEYTNTNFIVAGILVERVTGRPYAEELQRRVLAPLDLIHTYLPAAGEVRMRDPHPRGYTADRPPTDVSLVEPSIPWSAGALVSTGTDLNRFYSALVAGKVVAPHLLRSMLDGVPTDEGGFYGLGVGYADLPCGARYVGHSGGIHGFTTLSGATAQGRAVTFTMTGLPDRAVTEGGIDPRAMLTRALCR
ncbi:serine hydrolase domain-containing protein [Nocardia sp. NPDC051570]|uniref:serine hydrolase domain-containing protein n=1 Tax=Nocardia sp. NPDC051570 TaxID=3364324 RepID=UPI0037A1754C